MVLTVKGNQERCKEIGERAQRLVPALERISDQAVRNDLCTIQKNMGALSFLRPHLYTTIPPNATRSSHLLPTNKPPRIPPAFYQPT